MNETEDQKPDEREAARPPEPPEAAKTPAPEPEPELSPLEVQTQRADQLADRLKRAEAEFVNESKRLRRRSENDRKFAIEKVVIDLLPFVDALHTAISNLGDGEADERIREGLDLIGKQLLATLGRHGVEPIEADGQVFDPNRHEALFTQPREDVPPQTVVEVLRPGFTLNDRVVRAAEVAVSMAPAKPAVEPEAADPEGG